jgi:hypothetical protein
VPELACLSCLILKIAPIAELKRCKIVSRAHGDSRECLELGNKMSNGE